VTGEREVVLQEEVEGRSRKEGLRKKNSGRKSGIMKKDREIARRRQEKGRKPGQEPHRTGRTARKEAKSTEKHQEDQQPNKAYHPQPLLLSHPIQGLSPRRTHSRSPTHTKRQDTT
jgi:hypothetical protein